MLSLVLVVSFLLVLLEAARIRSMDYIAKEQTELAVMNTFAKYDTALWKKYRCLGRSLSGLEGDIIKNASAGNEEEALSLLNFAVSEIDDLKYTLFTDGEGSLFIKSVSNYMKQNMLLEGVQSLYSGYESLKGLMEGSRMDASNMDKALEVLKNIEASEQNLQKNETGKKEEVKQETEKTENPIQKIKELQKKGILELVIKDTSNISEAVLDIKNTVSNRELQKGTLEIVQKTDWVDRVLFQQYLADSLGSYQDVKNSHVFSYELEYLIGKKESDMENLKASVKQLLLVRQAANLLYLCSDAQKMQAAQACALGLAAVGVPPIITEILKMGILTAWAYGESILDVRALLSGRKIPLIKNAMLWTLELDEIGNLIGEFRMAKGSENGISYENYLKLLLFFEEEETLALKAMDLIEASIQQDKDDFYLDDMVIGTEFQIKYTYDVLFLSVANPYAISGNPLLTKQMRFLYSL
uniref:DUF5702 domain-containing protein n=1 Tax=Agathobacter sp. TaxID=2021311 RepID=UPI004055BDB7